MNNKDNSFNKNIYAKIFGITFGQISIACFFIALVSGVILALPYDVENPYESITKFLISNQPANFIRGMHYWSSQIFLITLILHLIDHLRLSTEKNVSRGVWLRLTLSLGVSVFLMFTGFLLKGDGESEQARRIFEILFQSIPLFGNSISFLLLGKSETYQIIYMHHIATASIFIVVVIYEHTKQIWPRKAAILFSLIPLTIITLLFTPSIHDNLNGVIKGPWYFLGLQETFYWLSWPVLILIISVVGLAAIYYLRILKPKYSLTVKKNLLALFILYLVLTLFGYFFRGENWEFMLPWKKNEWFNSQLTPIENLESFFSSNNSNQNIPIILGRAEGCMSCHNDMTGFSKAHDPSSIGCYSCHGGNPFTTNKSAAHTGMILIPGNMNNAKMSCGSANCHPDIIPRVENSIMNTMNGVVSVDKWVFGEIETPTQKNPIWSIKHSPADLHLRNLCASCHLSNRKEIWGPIDQLSRGGGCNACHLNYSVEALQELRQFEQYKSNGMQSAEFKLKYHPSLSINIKNDHCFGCHSRSGRISLSYDGWHELIPQSDLINEEPEIKSLEDGRMVIKVQQDIHSEKGMLCVDCHFSKEVMGDGNYYYHKEEQLIIQCVDCHSSTQNTIRYSDFNSESKKVADLSGLSDTSRKYLVMSKSSEPIINSIYENNKTYLIKKSKREKAIVKAPLSICVDGKSHKNLSCNSCHNSWTPQCIGCHTEFDGNGTMYDLLENKDAAGMWIEHQSEFLAEPATLGVREEKNHSGGSKKIITEFMPGMIMTLDKDMHSSKPAMEFKRLFSPSFSHTIRKVSRSCESCHNNSLALGYGRGKLEFVINKNIGRWVFTPQYSNVKFDGLPKDAWIPFLKQRDYNSTTRLNTRPFSIEEQKRILTVGACLICHDPNSSVMKSSLLDFEKVRKQITSKCILPTWN